MVAQPAWQHLRLLQSPSETHAFAVPASPSSRGHTRLPCLRLRDSSGDPACLEDAHLGVHDGPNLNPPAGILSLGP